MGREETMASTRFVPASVCLACYIASSAWLLEVLLRAERSSDPYWNALLAHVEATVVIFGFSFACGNSSLYDPAWVILPVVMVLGWTVRAWTEQGEDSRLPQRGKAAVCLVLVWFGRYQHQMPWEGWTRGIRTEDWRYVRISEAVHHNPVLYWIASLLCLHLTPTLLVWFAVSPLLRVCSSADAGSEDSSDAALVPTVWEWLGIAVCLAAVGCSYVADQQLQEFRTARYGPQANIHTSSSSKAILRTGLWRYSRHPNYFGEALFWFGIAILGWADDHRAHRTIDGSNWESIIKHNWFGSVVMFSFFYGSAHLTDRRMLQNRGAAYQRVMDETSALVPMPPWSPKEAETQATNKTD